MSLTVTCVDDATGKTQTQKVANDDHLIITDGRAHISSYNRYANGTVQYTIKLADKETP